MLIFLKNILTIESAHTNLTKTQQKKMGPFIKLTTHLDSPSRTEKKHWLLHKSKAILSDEDISVTSRLSSLPVKYQTLKKINIELAYEYDETRNCVVALEAGTEHTIFVTLPTEIQDLNLPFLLNTRLVLSANRKAFGEHKDCTKWNTITLKYAYLAQLCAITSLIACSKNHTSSILTILALPPTNTTRNIRWENIEAVFYPELDNTPMLLAEDDRTLLTPSNARFDKTKFITYLGTNSLKPSFVSSAVRKQKKLYSTKRYQSQILDFNAIASIIASNEFQTITSFPENKKLLFDFLIEYPVNLLISRQD